MNPVLWDMHVHLDFMRNAEEVYGQAAEMGLGLFGVTVSPQGFERIASCLKEAPNVRIGVGLHPWWAADGRCTAEDAVHAAELIRTVSFAGEIGLDASPKHVPSGSLAAQAEIFETLCRACNETAPKVLSLHSVRAAKLTLDILESTGCLDSCRCIFHWFSGSGDDLNRAIRSGCMFSVNELMLRTRRGRDYARQIPANRLLLETDLPPGEDIPFSADEITGSLERTLDELRIIRGTDMRSVIRENSLRLMNF